MFRLSENLERIEAEESRILTLFVLKGVSYRPRRRLHLVEGRIADNLTSPEPLDVLSIRGRTTGRQHLHNMFSAEVFIFRQTLVFYPLERCSFMFKASSRR